MTVHRYRTHLIVLNVLGFAGYMLAAFQWLLVLGLSLPVLIESPFGDLVLPKGPRHSLPEMTTSVPQTQPSMLEGIALTIVALAFLLGVLYVVVVRYTRAITKTTSEVAHTVTERVVPVIARKPVERIAPQRRTLLTRRILFWLKFSIVVAPVMLLTLFWYPHHGDLAGQLVVLVAAVLALIGIDAFLFQALLAKRWHIRSRDIR